MPTITYTVAAECGCQSHDVRMTGQEHWGDYEKYYGLIIDCPERKGWKSESYWADGKCIEAHEES